MEVNSLIENLIPVVSGKLRKENKAEIQIYNTIDKSQIEIENTGEMTGVNVGKGSLAVAGNVMSISMDTQSELLDALQSIYQGIHTNTYLSAEEKENSLSFLETIREEIQKQQPEFKTLNMASSALKNSLSSLSVDSNLWQSSESILARIIRLSKLP